MVTVVPTGPLVGEKPVIDGASGAAVVTVKLALLVTVLPATVTPIGPVRAVAGRVAVSSLSETTAKVAEAPL
jgi:hypothetical protein